MITQFVNDESGFVISAELVLVATLLVIGLVVGMAEVQSAVVQELNDVGEAIGHVNQTYYYTGFRAYKSFFGGGWGFGGGLKSYTAGSAFVDGIDNCDLNECALACAAPVSEAYKGGTRIGGACHPVGGTANHGTLTPIPAACDVSK
jgi:Flp pilus assembly pilin Flp